MKHMLCIISTILLVSSLMSCQKKESPNTDNVNVADLIDQPHEDSKILPEKIEPFETFNLKGDSVSESIFSKKDLTVVNVWGTFCGPCISEMPELAQWAKELPENVQILGIICDIGDISDSDGIAEAKSIIADAGVEFENIIAGDELYPLLKNIMFVPTTFLVDKDGTVIGDAITGAQVDAYKHAVADFLNGKK
ncbi:MAG: TlpA family protein disulfide reductase [Treponema sp.]|nr:TlpA family protein disulfide reductase [Treponema sp.]